MSNLPALLAELATIAPEVCQVDGYGRYKIGAYRFGYSDLGFYASCGYYATGRPAIAWLLDALQGVIEAKGWDYIQTKILAVYSVELHDKDDNKMSHTVGLSRAEALLTALIAALK